MNRTVQPCLSRRDFLTCTGALAAACGGNPVTAQYPQAPKCSPTACTMVDAHSHLFNGSDLPIEGFISHVLPLPRKLAAKLAKKIHRIINKHAPSGEDELKALEGIDSLVEAPRLGKAPKQLHDLAAELRQALGGGEAAHGGSATVERLVQTLQLIVGMRHKMAAELASTYSQVDLFTPTLVDYTYWSSDKPETPLADQLRVQAKISELSRRDLIGRKGVRIHPMAPFNPLREVREVLEVGDAKEHTDQADLDELKGSLAPLKFAVEELGFVGVKVYPPVGFLPLGNRLWHPEPELGALLDQALDEFYGYCQSHHVPVMTHTNNSNGYELGYGMLAEPKRWAAVLEKYPNLRLNLGHFGHLEGDDPERGLKACESWMRQAAVLMETYANVYADSGYSSVPTDQDFQDRYFELLTDLFKDYPRARKRFMYGSDFWLNTLAPKSETFVNAFYALFEDRFAEEQRQNFMGQNALRYLGLLDDQGAPIEGNLNRARLEKLYGNSRPKWL